MKTTREPGASGQAVPRQLGRDEQGYIVVETVGGFTLFILLITSILMLVNIVSVQNRVHYAVTQTAQEISMYCYALEVTGVADKLIGYSETADKVRGEISGFKDSLEGVIGGIENLSPADVTKSAEEGGDQLDGWIQNPKQTLMEFLQLGADELKTFAFRNLSEMLFKKYIVSEGVSYEQFQTNWGIIDGFDFSGTQFLAQSEDIEIVVTYKVDYTFGALPLPFTELTISHTAKTRAWLGGDGETYE
ncbi:hypothetical protein LJC63_10705 [Ruminococcaceae bacterium OttesenSCG-928-L11]|nr:hypothetical protein [Ruminococcaceae bacterium OttesenSCG-928-L11]